MVVPDVPVAFMGITSKFAGMFVTLTELCPGGIGIVIHNADGLGARHGVIIMIFCVIVLGDTDYRLTHKLHPLGVLPRVKMLPSTISSHNWTA